MLAGSTGRATKGGRIMQANRTLTGIGAGLVLLLAPGLTRAADMTSQQLAVHLGQQDYVKYCGSCHGPAGEGDGIASRLFKTVPSNLTLLARENGGKFPVNEVLSIVAGDTPIAAHGTREMPVWSEIIGRPESAGMVTQQAVNGRILTIIRYLETIQAK